MFLNNIIGSFNRNLIKRKTIQKTLLSPQFNISIVNAHRIDLNNIGDFYCAPHHYYKELKNTQIDIYDYKNKNHKVRENFIEKISRNALIIGGGGLLNRGSFEKQIKLFEKLALNNKKTVLWGVGHNEKSKSKFGKITNYNIDISNFGLAGTRDFSMPGDFVPCVSCKHEVFDKKYSEIEKLGFVFHKNTLKNKKILKKFEHYPSTSNTTNLEELITFIGKHNSIITNSYHAMYWSMLLDKKVAIIPNSSKFFDFKYKPIFTNFNDCLIDIKKAKNTTGILEESRNINDLFFQKVANYLDI